MPRHIFKLSLALAFAACASQDGADTSVDAGSDADINAVAQEESDVLRIRDTSAVNQFIVTLKPAQGLRAGDGQAVRSLASGLVQQVGGQNVRQVYSQVFQGFSAEMSEEAAANLASDPRVATVEANRPVYALGQTVQNDATWGIDRIDADDGLDKKYHYSADGSGVTAFVVDTGIRISHRELGGRATLGFSAIDDGNGANDCAGHGTHVAGTIGSASYGVAKGVKLVAVRVLDCKGSGTDETVIAGIDWVLANAKGPSVVNMSLGGEASVAFDAAIQAAIAKGITFVVAAGNESQDACNVSPARVPEAVTVGATNRLDLKAMYSNTGKCLDLFAPGSSIKSLDGRSDSGTASMNGTSMASPHVAGAAALYLSKHPAASPQEVREALVNNASKGQVSWKGNGSPDLLLNVSFIQ